MPESIKRLRLPYIILYGKKMIRDGVLVLKMLLFTKWFIMASRATFSKGKKSKQEVYRETFRPRFILSGQTVNQRCKLLMGNLCFKLEGAVFHFLPAFEFPEELNDAYAWFTIVSTMSNASLHTYCLSLSRTFLKCEKASLAFPCSSIA